MYKKITTHIKADDALRLAISSGITLTQFCNLTGFYKNDVKSDVKRKKSNEIQLNKRTL